MKKFVAAVFAAVLACAALTGCPPAVDATASTGTAK